MASLAAEVTEQLNAPERNSINRQRPLGAAGRQPASADAQQQQRAALLTLPVSRLRIRAAAFGATEEEIDDAYDSDTPRQDYVRLLLGLPVQDGAAQARALAALTVSELRGRSAACGATEGEIDDAYDGEDPKQAFIQLILSRTAEDAGALEQAEELPPASLAALPVSELRGRAAACGATEDELDDAYDGDSPKDAFIQLILSRAAPRDTVGKDAGVVAPEAEEEPLPPSPPQTDEGQAMASLTVSELRSRAAACGATEDEIDDAYDSDSPKDVFIELILSRMRDRATTRDQQDSDGKQLSEEPEQPEEPEATEQPEKPQEKERQIRDGIGRALAALAMSELRSRAAACGATEDEIDAAYDSETPKEVFIELIRTRAATTDAAAVQEQQEDGHKVEGEEAARTLAALSVSELRSRAAACGATEDEIDEAYDTDSPKEVFVRLVMRCTPPHGAAADAAPQPQLEPQLEPGGQTAGRATG